MLTKKLLDRQQSASANKVTLKALVYPRCSIRLPSTGQCDTCYEPG